MRVVILGSGRGSNAEAILPPSRRGGWAAPAWCRYFPTGRMRASLDWRPFWRSRAFLDPGPFKTKFDEAGETRYLDALRACEPGLIVLAGFMRILKPRFVGAFPRMIINLHPSLLPSFPGLDAIGQAWRHGVKVTGCTVHFVTAEVDGGPIIDQMAVRIEPDDTLATLEAKVHAAEHALLPAVIARLSETGVGGT